MARLFTQSNFLFSILFVSAFTVQSNADEYGHIDRLAVRIQNKARLLASETTHYRHTAEYHHLVSDTQEIARLARHIHDVTHFEGNLNHLVSDMSELDQKFHHLEDVFDRIEHDAAYGDGHVHGNTSHVKRLLNSIEDAIHHIQEDIETLQHRVIVYRPVYSGHGHGGHGSHGYEGHGSYGRGGYYRGRGIGFTIGGGSSRIHIRF